MGVFFKTNFCWPNAQFLSLLVAVGLVSGGCAGDRPPVAEEVDPLRDQARTVALAPLDSWVDGVAPEQVEAAFEQRAIDHLVKAGRTVVDPAAWKAIWRRHAEDVGGIYDPSTGEADEARLEAVREAVVRELVETRQVDAILRLFVRPVEAYGVSRVPEVCGRMIPPVWSEDWRNRGQGQAPVTLARFSCLVGVLSDPGGKEYFARQTGIEGIETYDEQTRVVRPAGEMLNDEQVLAQVVETVLAPFVPASSPSRTPSPPPHED